MYAHRQGAAAPHIEEPFRGRAASELPPQDWMIVYRTAQGVLLQVRRRIGRVQRDVRRPDLGLGHGRANVFHWAVKEARAY